MTSQPEVAVIVVNWNGGEQTLACLGSLRRQDYPACRIVLVDNASTDGSLEAVRQQFPEVSILACDQNLGFTGGNNLGLDWALRSRAGLALLLNNDAEIAPDGLSRLVKAAQVNPQAGVFGPTIYYYDRPQTVWSAGGAIDWRTGRTRMLEIGVEDRGQLGEQPRPVDFVSGCALLIRLPLLTAAGLLDPRFYLYYEETEWCVRIARSGWRILHVPQAHVWHKISDRSRAASPQVHYYMTRNRLLFLRCARAGLRPWLYTLLGDYTRTLLSWSLRPRWRDRRALRGPMLRAIGDYFQGRFGQAPRLQGGQPG